MSQQSNIIKEKKINNNQKKLNKKNNNKKNKKLIHQNKEKPKDVIQEINKINNKIGSIQGELRKIFKNNNKKLDALNAQNRKILNRLDYIMENMHLGVDTENSEVEKWTEDDQIDMSLADDPEMDKKLWESIAARNKQSEKSDNIENKENFISMANAIPLPLLKEKENINK